MLLHETVYFQSQAHLIFISIVCCLIEDVNQLQKTQKMSWERTGIQEYYLIESIIIIRTAFHCKN